MTRISHTIVRGKECSWYTEEFCETCKGTRKDFVNNCKRNEEFIEMAFRCPNCTKGIINPTFNKMMACDKCGYEKTVEEVAKVYKILKKYLL